MSLLAQRSDSYAFCLSQLCCHGSCGTWTLKADIKKKGSQGHTERQTKHPSCPGNYPWIWNISLVKAPFYLPSKELLGAYVGSAVVGTPVVGASPNGSVGSAVVVTAVVGASPNGSVGSAVVGPAVVGVSVGSVVVSSVDALVVSSAS